LVGFVLPTYVLAGDAVAHLAASLTEEFWRAAMHSLGLSLAAALLSVIFAVILAYGRRQTQSRFVQIVSFVPAVSYAVPGTVLAIGLLIPLAGLDNTIDDAARSLFGVSTGLIFSGSAFAIVVAYTIRFLAASLGSVEAGLSKISRNIDAAGRTLGASVSHMLWRVHLPLLRPALGAAALIVFVDSMKELPATLLLRPFNFDTLATHVYTLASLYRYEEAGLSALTIVVISLVPVLFLHGILARSRPGGASSYTQRSDPQKELALPIS
jgi:iron(III) transport system permease protein